MNYRERSFLPAVAETGGVPLMVEKQAGAGSRRRILRGWHDGLVGHLLEWCRVVELTTEVLQPTDRG